VEDFSAFIVVIQTYRFLRRGFGAFLRRGLLTILCAALALFLALQDSVLNLSPETFRATLIGLALLAALFAVQFVIGWHRYALGPEIEGAQRLRQAVTYLRATLVIALLALIPPFAAVTAVVLLGAAISIPVAVLTAFLMALVIGKLSLAWPAAAIGRHHVLRHGWIMSSGLVPQLVVTLLLTSAPFHAAAGGLLYLHAGDYLPQGWLGPLALAVVLLVLLGIAAGATALSFAYRWRLRQDNSHWWRYDS
jgi:hypothetical protein